MHLISFSVKNTNLDNGDIVTWAGFNSSIKPRATIGVLTLFLDKAVSVSMHVVNDETQFLNPGQTPVLGMDQPIYVIGKLIRWKLSEDTFGSLHTEFVIEAIEYGRYGMYSWNFHKA